MNTSSSNPTPDSARRENGAKHPVLARLPDVSDQLPTLEQSARAAAAGFVDYRFDSPAGVGDDPARTHQVAQPHLFQRSPRADYRARTLRGRSRILPDSNPFSLPVTSLHDRLAPVVRFLTLFALFTAAGTTLLMTGGRNQPSSEPGRPRPRSVAPATTSAQQSLEPATNTVQPPMVAPTAVGPLGVNPQSAIDNTQSEIATAQAMPMPTLARANGTPLPQVQTSDARVVGVGDDPARQPAIARLPGYILEAPSRQAHHDDNQSGLH